MSEPRLCPKPWWLRLVTSPGTWVTLSPIIYHPASMPPRLFPGLVAHETVHIWQQESTGKWRFLWRWFTSKRFRLAVEAEGIAAEILAAHPFDRAPLVTAYADLLAGRMYFWAARTPMDARCAIVRALNAGFAPTP